jgi:hypothetical protein
MKEVIGLHVRARLRVIALSLTALAGAGLIVGPAAAPAAADPGCTTGVYAVFARGSGEHLNDLRANQFYRSLKSAITANGTSFAWSELGNEDASVPVNMALEPGDYAGVLPDAANQDPFNEYRAIAAPWNAVPPSYGDSVRTGTNELIAHINDRASRCPNESIVLGGYSQGADVVGWAIQRTGWGSLSQAAKDRIGYVALYGDPKLDPGALSQRQQWQRPWWIRGDDPGFRFTSTTGVVVPNRGVLGPRQSYVPNEFAGRFGSWCAYRDGVCTGSVSDDFSVGSHSSAYQNNPQAGYTGWIQVSAAEIANKAIGKRNQLNPSSPPASRPSYTIAEPDPVTNPPIQSGVPAPPTIKEVKREADHTGTYQVYAATSQAVTEAWWHPGEGVQTKEMIHISQGNIVGFDKVNEPDGTTQSLYTAVPDGVWETWWRPGDGPHSTKIVTGLTGVRQIIADPVTDGGQYTHRLYVLASDGPYEVWWREGGDGIHVNRLDIVNDPVTMTKSRGPDGTDQLYVATPTWVYELWWRPNTAVNHGSVINITQGDIRSLDKGANLPDGGQLLYTGTSTTAWQTYWNSANGTGISHGTITVGQTNAGQVKKTVYNGDHQLYQTNGCRVQENWWNGPNSGSSTLINISQCNITSFDKSADGPDQQLYTASGDLVYETWWRGGSNPSGPNTSVLFKVAR